MKGGIVALVVATAVALQLSSSSAAAAQRNSTVRAVSTPSMGVGPTAANYDVSCPKGQKAVGGGFNTVGILVAGDLVPGGGPVPAVVPVVFESRRLDSRTWRVTERAALNPAVASFAPNGTTVTASVYCRKVKGRVLARLEVGDVARPGSPPSTGDPSCPKRYVALSGGWSVSTGPETGFLYPSIYESFRDGRGAWRSSVAANTESTADMIALVYCSKERKPPRTRRLTGGSGSILVSCPKGLAAAAGGFKSAPGYVPTQSIGSSGGKKPSYPAVTAYPAGPVWMVGAGSFGPPLTTTAFAYCS
ncbi:MAG TPA: hypothetical protein VH329_04590 [Solirubrobacterales bacterium]|jgi:hypothetical protein